MSIAVKELFAEELEKQRISVFTGERAEVPYEELRDTEIEAVETVFSSGLGVLKKVCPKIADDIAPQLGLAIKVAGIFKEMVPEKKVITFPSEPGTIGVSWLFPQAIKYAATPSATTPCYTSYKTNSWDIDLTAGTAAYIFGDGTNFYKASPQTGKHSMLLIFNNGIIEVGSTPRIDQFRLITEGVSKYGIYTVAPLVEEEVELGRTIYQYSTPLGAIPVFYDRGIMLGFMPRISGTSTIKLLGLVFYEHELYPNLTWIA